MTKRRRIFAAVLAALVALVVLSSSVFLIEHADHDCAGEDCPVCRQLDACVQNLKNLAAAALVVLVAAVFTAAARICADGRLSAYAPRTPVALKVKLSN
ncbi:MAG: hypothetical protein E7474_04755 [Ruminococcaceae bacterium]|nr:hypothetical protein [Oscillospiraceae bacterium]